ncbi:hypothetical protein THASP1DRAFT_28039 [Thamnocephalis sphaerospora]|uniref:GYF domain-containing protein n=1 Tax=Thamnocephalis sphaerospora TaxID=78915 RepID=A0A4P9XVC2_9FUNG|nr:hypothetical protein THASP1DRAFT_28039 [Thamnocephalis sphaerospora]|eukprot:RKP10198.1 hypothetical protein THASP1DRAFT_28039 [Thamnocephalis sphaerospora]
MKRHTDRNLASEAKKVRFDEKISREEDADDFDQEEQLEERKTRRGGVKLDGYDGSSSSDEDQNDSDEDKGGDRQSQQQSSAAGGGDNGDMDMDMFAMDVAAAPQEGSSNGARTNVRNKQDTGDEDGQEYASFDRYDPEAGEAKIEAFNMRAELEEGQFDENGHYVRNQPDPQGFHDRWLEGVSNEEMERAREAHVRRERDRRRQQAEEERELGDTADADRAARLDLMELLQPNETVAAAIRRLGGSGDARKKTTARNRKQRQQGTSTTDAAGDVATLEQVAARRQNVELATALCDRLMGLGQLDVYEWTRERIALDLRRAGVTLPSNDSVGIAHSEFTMASGPTASAASAVDGDDMRWQFKWEASDAAEIHGPHTTAELQAWHAHGYFGPDVVVRRVGDSTFRPLSEAGVV